MMRILSAVLFVFLTTLVTSSFYFLWVLIFSLIVRESAFLSAVYVVASVWLAVSSIGKILDAYDFIVSVWSIFDERTDKQTYYRDF